MKNVYLEGLPIFAAKFINSNNEIIASGMKKHLLSYNLVNDKLEKISSFLFTNRFDKKINNFTVSNND